MTEAEREAERAHQAAYAALTAAREHWQSLQISVPELKHNKKTQENITERLNEVYSEHSNSLDPLFVEMRARSLDKDDW